MASPPPRVRAPHPIPTSPLTGLQRQALGTQGHAGRSVRPCSPSPGSGASGPPGPRLPPLRAGGWPAPEAGSQGFAQGLTSAAGSSCPGPAPARACETRPAAPQARMPPTAPACHGAQQCPNSLPRARRAGLGTLRAAACSSIKWARQRPSPPGLGQWRLFAQLHCPHPLP